MNGLNDVPPLRFKMSPSENAEGGRLPSTAEGSVRIPVAPWVRTQLGEINGQWFKGQAFSRNLITENGKYNCVHYGELFTRYGAVADDVVSRTDERPLVSSKFGDVLFPASDVTPDGLGRCTTLLKEGVLLGGDIIGFRQSECEPAFLSYAVNNAKQQIIRLVSGTTVRHSSASRLACVNIAYPPSATEQRRIGSFFRSLDALIAGREKALEKLESLKKSMLLKMFPQGDAKVPAMRFKGFESEWEKKRLGELNSQWFKGQAFSKCQITERGKYKCIHYGELFTLYGAVVNNVVSKTNVKPLVASKVGDILFPASDVTPDGLGRCTTLHEDNVLLGGDIIGLRQSTCDSVFLSYAVNNAKQQIIRLVSGTTVRHSSASMIASVNVTYPRSLLEQQKIGAFFRSLDALITARREETEKLKQMKKALLERMFV